MEKKDIESILLMNKFLTVNRSNDDCCYFMKRILDSKVAEPQTKNPFVGLKLQSRLKTQLLLIKRIVRQLQIKINLKKHIEKKKPIIIVIISRPCLLLRLRRSKSRGKKKRKIR
jgi:hypothetical protein